MNERIREFFIGKECYKCKTLGVFCIQPGILPVSLIGLSSEPVAPFKGSAIYIDGRQMLQARESIEKCPVITGQNSKKEVVAKLRKTANEAWGRVVVDQVGNW